MIALSKVLLHVRKINGETAPPINTEFDFKRMLDRFGEDACEVLFQAYAKYFTPRTSLKVLKKICTKNLDWHQLVVAVRYGLPWRVALEDETVRQAFFYSIVMQEGNDINWNDGSYKPKR